MIPILPNILLRNYNEVTKVVNTQIVLKYTKTNTSANNAKLEYKSDVCINIRFIFTRH